MRLVELDKKDGMKALQSLSTHCINTALYQTKLPLSDALLSANKMCPLESLHTLDARLILDFLQDGEDVNAAAQCAIDPVPWTRLEEEFIATSVCARM